MEYFIKASAVLGIFYICYKLFLQRETFFNSNRWFLLAGLTIASVLPLLVIPIYVEYSAIAIPNTLLTDSTLTQSTNSEISFLQIATWIYTIGFIFFLGKLSIEFTSLFTLLKNNNYKKEDGFIYIETNNNVPPFSFFNWIVYNPTQFHEQELIHIINHEKVHARQYHSIDVIFSQISCVVFWFNPFCWLYKKELQQNLEFIADYKAQNISNCEKSYQRLLLKASIPNHQLLITNNFYNSLIKKRIVMLHKSKSNKLNAWKFTLVLPLLGLFLMSFNTKEVYINTSNPINTDTSENIITNNLTDIEVVIITKDFSDAELEKVKNNLLKDGLTIKFNGVKRNASGEIIAIKIDVESKESSANYNTNGDEPISPIKISFNKDGNNISIGSASIASSKHAMTFISEDGHPHKIKSHGNNKHVYVISSDDHNSDEDIEIESDGEMIFISEDGEVHTITDGDQNIEIITISEGEDGEELIYKTKGNAKSKNVWVTKEDISDGQKEKTYEVKIISSDGNDEDIHFTTNDSDTKHKINVFKMNKNGGSSTFSSDASGNALIYIDGKEATKEQMDKLNADLIAAVEVFKGEKAVKKYGEKAKDGVIVITTKK
ncbi:M56 family metallopeptidase [Xanthomarina spongicola]|uniref:Beta-lactamase regulating signal transducer with metallopeptidase domain n=1 Tax=Xanthomarina spongicola TaxID=570520 RepID=A0A316DKA4_9FLAO|nr:M56 family metallopeptidase [Xanthomarina spongicola]PWK18305.1 beta-lactamase regulating signal transducer with metallopeptidase domain [Xanthomarina spongicola]